MCAYQHLGGTTVEDQKIKILKCWVLSTLKHVEDMPFFQKKKKDGK